MFYTTEATIYHKSEGYINDYGIHVEGKEELIDNVLCDIQPINEEIVYNTYSLFEKAEYKVYMPLNNNISVGHYIEFKDESYQILSIKRWDEYMVLIVGGKDD